MAYRVKLTKLAEADAYAAYDYIRQLAPHSAEKWLAGLFLAISSLNEMPNRCPLISEAKEIGQPVRHYLYGKRTASFRVIFDIQEPSEDSSTVRVLRIWRSSRDKITLSDVEARD